MKKISETIKGLNVSDLSRFRGEIMGFAIIQVLILHFVQGYNSAHSDVLSVIGMGYIGLTGSVGVDMFAIMSGIGLFYSLSANSAVGQFFKKRFTRVVIPYLIWCPVIFAACALIEPESGFLQDVCYHLFFGSFLFEKNAYFLVCSICIGNILACAFCVQRNIRKKTGICADVLACRYICGYIDS